jgi:hypothetical protein
MLQIRTPTEMFQQARRDLSAKVERVGFFLAGYQAAAETLVLREWWLVPPTGYEGRSPYHVTLTDEAQNQAIRWAWNADACLVEVHSHGDLDPAGFSPSDLAGFEEWVPHLWWRLRGRPYAAIVTARKTIDAIVWTTDAGVPEAVSQIVLDDGSCVPPTGRTIERLAQRQQTRRP